MSEPSDFPITPLHPRGGHPSLKTWTMEPSTCAKHEGLQRDYLFSFHELKEKSNLNG